MLKAQKNPMVSSRGLRYKLKIILCLVTVLPFLICSYIISYYILPYRDMTVDAAAAILLSAFIAMMGFFVVKEVFDRVIAITAHAKLLAEGDLNARIEVASEDEVGELGDALNQLTRHIKLNMDELKNYSQRTNEINFEIQKRVLMLSSLLQVSSLVSQGAKLDEILKMSTEKSRLLADSDIAYLFFREEGKEKFVVKSADGINSDYLLELSVDSNDIIFGKAASLNKPVVVDKDNIPSSEAQSYLAEKFKLKNTMAVPVYLRGRVVGILCVGNSRDTFLYKNDEREVLEIFAKQIVIAVENDILSHRVEKLEIKDALTGLYNAPFIKSRLQEEIKRAIVYQRPCSLVLLNVDNFSSYKNNFGPLEGEAILKGIAVLIKDSVTEIDRVGRTGDNDFAVILPERNKRRGQDIAEDIRRKIEARFKGERDPLRRLTVSAGISENPLDGTEAEELLAKAKSALAKAKEQGKNKVAA